MVLLRWPLNFRECSRAADPWQSYSAVQYMRQAASADLEIMRELSTSYEPEGSASPPDVGTPLGSLCKSIISHKGFILMTNRKGEIGAHVFIPLDMPSSFVICRFMGLAEVCFLYHFEIYWTNTGPKRRFRRAFHINGHCT